jgi:hypothetical protein
MIALEERIKEMEWTQTEAAEILHVNQLRVSDLMDGGLHKFSLDALVNVLPRVGLTFDVRPSDRPGRHKAAKVTRETDQTGNAAPSKRSAPQVAAAHKKPARA